MHKRTYGLAALMGLAGTQAGLVSRAQVLDHGFTDSWLDHQLKAARWQRIHTGVYATFTGGLSWDTRCWAALLRCGDGAALAGPTAVSSWQPTRPTAEPSNAHRDIVVAVEGGRRPRSSEGVEVWTLADLERHVHPTRRPPVMRFESAVILTASHAASRDQAVSALADACQSRRTTPARLLALLETLPTNLRLRRFLREVLVDVATGAYSFLEVRYLRDVERPHGLPTGTRQRRVTVGRRPYFRDVEYLGLGVVAELDGRLGHEDLVARADDMDRDTDAARSDARTARIGYLQVMSRRCMTAHRVADLLRLGGWEGALRRCGPGCAT